MVEESAARVEDPGFESRLRRDFSRSSHASDLKIGTPVATLPGAWRYRVSTGTGRPGVSILWLGEVGSLIPLSVAARKIVQIRPWGTLACFWDVKQATNQQTKQTVSWVTGFDQEAVFQQLATVSVQISGGGVLDFLSSNSLN